MREHQTSSLLVVSRDRRVLGVVHEDDVAEAIRRGAEALPRLSAREVTTVGPDTQLADLLADAAATRSPLAVVDDAGVLVGLIPRVTLLSALADPNGSGHETDAPEPDAATDTQGGAR